MGLHVCGIPCIIHGMTDRANSIANKVRGVTAEKRYSQLRVAQALGISRTSVVERFNGRVPFTAEELLTLSIELDAPIDRFYPTPAELAEVTRKAAAA